MENTTEPTVTPEAVTINQPLSPTNPSKFKSKKLLILLSTIGVILIFGIGIYLSQTRGKQTTSPTNTTTAKPTTNVQAAELATRTIYQSGGATSIFKEESTRYADGSLETKVSNNNTVLSHQIYLKDKILSLINGILTQQNFTSPANNLVYKTTGENFIGLVKASRNPSKVSTTLNGKAVTVYTIGATKKTSFEFIKSAFAQTSDSGDIKVYVDDTSGSLEKVESLEPTTNKVNESITYENGPKLLPEPLAPQGQLPQASTPQPLAPTSQQPQENKQSFILKLGVITPLDEPKENVLLSWEEVPGTVKYNVFLKTAGESDYSQAPMLSVGTTSTTVSVNKYTNFYFKVEACSSQSCIRSNEVFLPGQQPQTLEPKEVPVEHIQEISKEAKQVKVVNVETPVALVASEPISLFPLSVVPIDSGYNTKIIKLTSKSLGQDLLLKQLLETGASNPQAFAQKYMKVLIDGSLVNDPEMWSDVINSSSPQDMSGALYFTIPQGLAPGYHTIEIFAVDKWLLGPSLMVSLPQNSEGTLEIQSGTPPTAYLLPNNQGHKVTLSGKNIVKPFIVVLSTNFGGGITLDDSNVLVNSTEELVLNIPPSVKGAIYDLTISKGNQTVYKPNFIAISN